MSNRLKNETSPYLLQHAENPVSWYPWGREAFEKAKAEDKPVFLSIGYSTCHWCHVMAHESFEDERTAELLNRYFISIKVDREERPDIDSVYMSVCQAFTGSGGWPMSIFMTWEKKPFFAGTYFPVRSQYGMPGFSDLLTILAAQWKENRPELLQSAEEVIVHLKEKEPESEQRAEENLAETAVAILKRSFDEINGGFGQAPKFPTPHTLLFLTLYGVQNEDSAALHMVEKTLTQMRRGGIFDQIGGGFSRYSTDARFLVPHFEKMLYDNALLIMAYAAAYDVTKKEVYLTAAKQTAEYVLCEMTAPEGGFYSAQDADSEGIEGKYYTFAWEELLRVLGETKGKAFAEVFDITPEGNFEGVNIPNLLKSGSEAAEFAEEKRKLYEYRKKRTRLHLDDKVLLSWNAMMAAALSMLFRVSKEERYLQAAKRAQAFLEKNLCQGTRLCASWRNGKQSEHGFLCDYAFYIAALTELYHSTLERRYLEQAVLFCREAVKRFADRENGGYFLSETESGELFLNPKESYDGAVPSGNSMMAYNLVRLYQLTGKEEFKSLADGQLSFLSGEAQHYPAGHTMFLLAKLLYENPPQQITIVVKKEEELKKGKDRLPFLANVRAETEGTQYRLLNDKTTYYVCKNHVCLPPVNEIGEDGKTK